MGCHALYLTTGNSIYCQIIKASTISAYLKATKELIQHLDLVPGRKAQYNANGDTYIGISKLINELKYLEKVLDRRKGYTVAMRRESDAWYIKHERHFNQVLVSQYNVFAT